MRLRQTVGVLLVVAVGALFSDGHRPSLRPMQRTADPAGPVQPATEVAGSTFSLASGFENLSLRLRVPPPTAPVIAVPEAAPPGDAPIAPPPEQFNEAPEPPAPEPVELRTTSKENVPRSSGTWAVIIGINNYPGTSHDLQSAVNDANDVNQALTRFGVAGERRLLLRDTEASIANIRKSVEWLNANAGPDATAVFFYAGHVRKIRAGTEAMVAADGGMMSDAELAGLLDGLQARKVWVGIAACYGGGFTEVMKPGRVLVAAASADEVAYENLNFARSYLVEYMVRRAMIGSGLSTVEGAFAAAHEGLRRDFPNRVPVQFDQLPGALELRVVASRPTSTAPPPAAGSPGSPPPPGGSAPPPPPPPPPDDGCSGLTGGIVQCRPGG
ncbi:MAG: caspase family protein [Actinobacteria bacterium]|nr:caspase family protein [Actinomycetota bacterium]